MKIKPIVIMLTLLLLISFVNAEPISWTQKIIVFNETDFNDTIVWKDDPTLNYSDAVIYQIGNTGGTGFSRGLIDLKKACSDDEIKEKVIQNITLTLWVDEGRNPSSNYTLYPMNRSWQENASWNTCGGDGCNSSINHSFAISTHYNITAQEDDTYINFSINLSYYTRLCDDNFAPYDKGVLIKLDPETDGTTNFDNFGSSAAVNPLHRPRLIIHYLSFYTNTTNIYNQLVNETDLISYKIVVNSTDNWFSANLTANNINYSGTKSNSSTQINFTARAYAPLIINGDGNLSFYWTIGNSTEYFSTNTINQTILPLNVSNCTLASTQAKLLNFSVLNEINHNPLMFSLGGVIRYYKSSSTVYKNLTLDLFDNYDYQICSNLNDTVYFDADLSYNTSGGFTQRWFLRNANLSNVTSNVDMYNYDDTTGVSDLKGSIKDEDYDYFPNVIVKLLRFYPSLNLWKTVQMDNSDDQGQIFFNIIEQSVDYKMIFEYNLNVLRITNPLKFICTSGICSVTFVIDSSVSAGVSANMGYEYSYNNNTGIVTVTFNDPTGLSTSVRLNVVRVTPGGTTTICDNAVSGSSGTVTCDLSGHTGNFIAKFYSSASPEAPLFTQLIDRVVRTLTGLIPNNEGNILGFGIGLTMIAIGLFSPVSALIAMIFGLIIIGFLGLINYVNVTFIILASIGAVLVGLKMRR